MSFQIYFSIFILKIVPILGCDRDNQIIYPSIGTILQKFHTFYNVSDSFSTHTGIPEISTRSLWWLPLGSGSLLMAPALGRHLHSGCF